MNIAIYINPDSPNAIEYLIRAFEEGIDFSAVLIIRNEKAAEQIKRIITERTGGLYQFKDFYKLMEGKRIPSYFIKSINSPEAVALIKELGIDILLLGGPEIVKEEAIKAPRRGILNCHPSDIARFRGCSNVEWAIYEDYPIRISCHFISKEVDAGPLVYQGRFDYLPGMTYAEIRTGIIYAQARTMIEGVKKLRANPLMPLTTPPQGEYRKVIRSPEIDVVMEKIERGTYVPNER